jgi:hypothetical protein
MRHVSAPTARHRPDDQQPHRPVELDNVQQRYDTAAVRRIHWQRCLGTKSGTGYDSSYGTSTTAAGTIATPTNAGTTAASGMGDSNAQVTAPG